MSIKKLRNQLFAAIAMVLVASIALGSSTYAWFVNNTTVKTTASEVSASTAYALLISEGADGNTTGWVTTHKMTQISNLTMVPVSTTGKTSVGAPMTFWKSNEWATVGSEGAKESLVNTYSTTTANTEYLTETFQIKASQKCNLYLDSETVIQAAGTASATSTLNKTLRVALVVTDTNSYNKTFFYQVDATTGSGTANTTNGTADGVANAVNDGSQAGAAALAAISTDNLVDSKVPELKTVAATNTALVELSAASATNVDTLYVFNNPEDVCTVTVYIWMEGCDVDCTAANITNLTGEENKVSAVFGFCAGKNS